MKKDSDLDETPALTHLSELVEELYKFRDYYFENFPIKEASEKNGRLKKKLEQCLQELEKHKELIEPKDRAVYFYLVGRALNVSSNYDPKAEEALSRAIKLDMKLYTAWNELGECYWKKEDITEAKNCFQSALTHKRNKRSLRNMSMVLRMEKAGNTAENVEQGMRFAKEAVELDSKDGSSWSVLGNAYLSVFFNISQNPTILNQCKAAYSQAEKDVVAKSNPDLHYNKAIVAKYEEDYMSALLSFQQAILLDPSWTEVQIKQKQLLHYLEKINDLCRAKGKIKGKKLAKMIAGLNPTKNLGPYGGGRYKAKNGQEIKLVYCNFKDLQEGLNDERVILGPVVCSIQVEDNVPFTFVMVDSQESVLVVTVYNLAASKGVLIGDYVAIPEPFVSHIVINYENKSFSFCSVRVVSPLVMVVNGKKVDKSFQCGLQFSTFAMAD